MIWKLSLTGIKSRFKDYLVLFSGLVISSTIFYMFLSLALNPAFLRKNMSFSISITQYIFIFGAILLGIITVAYVNFANNFLLSMRKKDYGTYLMLGAKSRKIGNLIFSETLITGFLSTIVGILLGILVSHVVTDMLLNLIQIKISSYSSFVFNAVLYTVLFYIAIFFLAAIFNRIKLTKTPVIKLLKEEQSPVTITKKKFLRIIFAILGIGLLATGYSLLLKKDIDLKIIVASFFTITFGSYSFFKASLGMAIDFLRLRHQILYKKLHSFTLGQLKFRIEEYTQILAAISIFFALALGAITVGMRFESYKNQYASTTYYDAVVQKETAKTTRLLKEIKGKTTARYNFKETNKVIYFNQSSFKKTPLVNLVFDEKAVSSQSDAIEHMKTVKLTAKKNEIAQMTELLQEFLQTGKKIQFVSNSEYQKLTGKVKQFQLIRTKDMRANYSNLKELNEEQTDSSQGLVPLRPVAYQMVIGLVSGFEFMGFFLGVAFLAMLASTLMFKVLTGAKKDQIRYQMLSKLGFRDKQIKSAINQEVGILFFLPAVLGLCHVLFGLKLFERIVIKPYQDFWIPFTIFLLLYLIYYFATIKLYQSIALKKVK